MFNKPTVEINPYDAQAHLLKLLTHPARLAIINVLQDGEQCVCHIQAHLGFRQAYISQQLAVLREAGLVLDRRDGWNVFYHVTDPRIFNVLTAVEQIVVPENSSFKSGQSVTCSCPKCNT